MKRHNFKKPKIWEEGMQILDDTYELVKGFPILEKFNRTSQLLRCSVAIPSNIAEGTSKSTDRHFNTSIAYSLSSWFEWETQLIIARRKNYIKENQFSELSDKIQQL
ncbi:MAG: four helix bundle protein [Bacteroidota bacterium]